MSCDGFFVFAVTTESQVVTLNLTSQGQGFWQTLPNCSDLLCKRISAGPRCLWAIGSDQQVHLYVQQSDISITVKEVAYENQRWNPVGGFTSKLLPTDRYVFSSVDGLENRELSSICLPSQAWQWNDEWHFDTLLNGSPLETEGWTYAVDFPRSYSPEKQWNSYVRRRKWVRNRSYVAVNKWTPLPLLEINQNLELFLDIAVGGYDVPGAVPGSLVVWAITINGLLLFREGIGASSPEGTEWVQVSTPVGWEPCQVSVAPNGSVWIVTWRGTVLERVSVTWDNLRGSHWKEVAQLPETNSCLAHVALGTHVAWALDTEGNVWMKKDMGNGWKRMTGRMSVISAGPNNQICAVSVEDQAVYVRRGISSSETGGKLWSRLEAAIGNREIKFTWVAVYGCGSDYLLSSPMVRQERHSYSQDQWRNDIISKLRARIPSKLYQDYENPIDVEEWIKSGRARYLSVRGPWVTVKLHWGQDALVTVTGEVTTSYSAAEITQVCCGMSCSLEIHFALDQPLYLFFGCEEEAEDWAAHITKACSSCRQLPEKLTGNSFWGLTSAGDAFVSEPCYFAFSSGEVEMRSTSQYPFIQLVPSEFRVGTGFCIKGRIPMNADRFSVNLQCGKIIEPHEAFAAKRDVALHVNPRFENGICFLISNTHIQGLWGEEERTDNVDLKPGSDFTLVIEYHKESFRILVNDQAVDYRHRISVNQITHLVVKGDVEDVRVTYILPKECPTPWFMYWRQTGGHFRHIESSASGIVWAVGSNGTCWIYSGGYGGTFFKGLLSSSHGIHRMTDEDEVHIYENQRWNPVSGFTSRGLPTDRPMWSDESGRKNCTKTNTTLPNRHWSWTSDWMIDYHPPGGADREGWQYAVDFPARYHGYKGILDYVRRRRWIRKRRLLTTGPWLQFGLTKLRDVSIGLDISADNEVPLWAVTHNGDVLSRTGVNVTNPQGDEWEHVASEYKFKAISVGSNSTVWALTEDGMPVLRHGITSGCRNGTAWLPIDRPGGTLSLKQITAGHLEVWAIDEQNRLYKRRDIVPVLPEGTGWDLIDTGVLYVSLGKNNQVWAVHETQRGSETGILGRRRMFGNENGGTEWDLNISGNWKMICAKGFSDEKHDIPH